jgi:hypothetical protein
MIKRMSYCWRLRSRCVHISFGKPWQVSSQKAVVATRKKKRKETDVCMAELVIMNWLWLCL